MKSPLRNCGRATTRTIGGAPGPRVRNGSARNSARFWRRKSISDGGCFICGAAKSRRSAPSLCTATDTTPAPFRRRPESWSETTPAGAASTARDASSAARTRSSSQPSSKLPSDGRKMNSCVASTNNAVSSRSRADKPPGQMNRRDLAIGVVAGGAPWTVPVVRGLSGLSTIRPFLRIFHRPAGRDRLLHRAPFGNGRRRQRRLRQIW